MIDVLRALGAALGLEAGLYRDYTSATLWAALGVALLAGASTMLGHVAILLLNKISGLRLITSLLLSFVSLVFLYGSQGAVTWAVATVALRRPLPLVPLIAVALLSLAPLAFNFVTALPHLGLGIGRLLQAWSFLVLWLGVGVTFQLSWPWALGVTITGWLVMQLLSRLLHRPLDWLYSRLWTLATGRPTMVTSQDILSGMPIIPVVAE